MTQNDHTQLIGVICDTQHKRHSPQQQCIQCHYAECRYADCADLFTLMLSVFMVSA